MKGQINYIVVNWTPHSNCSSQTMINFSYFIYEFCKHNKLLHDDAALKAIAGRGCEWNAIAKHIAREHPKQLGSEHLPCELTRAAPGPVYMSEVYHPRQQGSV